MTFGEKLKNMRTVSGKTQAEMADLLNISLITFNAIESGTSLPDLQVIKAVAEYFDISADQLIGVRGKCRPAFPPCRIAAFMERGESVESFCNRIGIDTAFFYDLKSGDALIDYPLAKRLSNENHVDEKFVYGLPFKVKMPEEKMPSSLRNDILNDIKNPARWDLERFKRLGGYFTDDQRIPLTSPMNITVSCEERDAIILARNAKKHAKLEVYRAAESDDSHADKIEELTSNQIDKFKNAPETDDDFH